MPDKFAATWLSHSSVSDFLVCPRAYYLKNVYKDPRTNHKLQITSPALSLGLVVHDVVEALSVLPTNQRFATPLLETFDQAWEHVSGELGGFTSVEQETRYKKRGEAMISKVVKNPGPLLNKAIKIQQDLPWFWLSEPDEIILCGKIDWLEYLESSDSVHIIDFKTSKREESAESLQLPIYYVLASNTQSRSVTKLSYWYLELYDRPTEQELPDNDLAREQILAIGLKMKTTRQLKKFDCPQGTTGCQHCQPFERILNGEGTLVKEGSMGRDVYVLPYEASLDQPTEIIL